MAVRTVGIRTLKDKLSEYLRLASAGETILSRTGTGSWRSWPPPASTRADQLPDALLAEAVRSGLVAPAALPTGPPPEAPGVAPLDDVLAELARDRAER